MVYRKGHIHELRIGMLSVEILVVVSWSVKFEGLGYGYKANLIDVG